MKRYYLGIDTSCYTTSCAIIDSDFQIVGEAQCKILGGKTRGERGLQQSNMVFQHTRHCLKLISELPQVPISGIGVSGFPRREENSYMPAFMVGLRVWSIFKSYDECTLQVLHIKKIIF